MATIAPHEPLRASSDARYRQLENRLKRATAPACVTRC